MSDKIKEAIEKVEKLPICVEYQYRVEEVLTLLRPLAKEPEAGVINNIEKYKKVVPLYMQGMLERGEIDKAHLDKWLAEEPPQGEFTKELREYVRKVGGDGIILEACKVIDRQAAELKHILDVTTVAVRKELICYEQSEHRKGISPEYIAALKKIQEKQDAN